LKLENFTLLLPNKSDVGKSKVRRSTDILFLIIERRINLKIIVFY
jgi:hypothetical protein